MLVEDDTLLGDALQAGLRDAGSALESQLYEWNEALDSNAIEVYVHRLRRKLAGDLIRTVRGVGYMLPRGD